MSSEIDITEFKEVFPQWAGVPDTELAFWQDIAACMVCLPKRHGLLVKRVPMLMLAHILTLNNVRPTAEEADPIDADSAHACDDAFLNEILAGGARISSVSLEGLSASFDNGGVNQLANTVGKSAFSSWLALSRFGIMVAAILPRLYAGPTMAHTGGAALSHYGDDQLLPHLRIPGHG